MKQRDEMVLLGHGSGGRMSQRLIEKVVIPALGDSIVEGALEDASSIAQVDGEMFFSTDSYVVDPIIFPGGDIGDLSVNGTVNDLAMRGAQPVALSLALILEEGLPMDDLAKVVTSAGKAAIKAGVKIVCGDTKVTPRGSCDKIFINTAGIGVARSDLNISATNATVGDVVIINGAVGDHGSAVMLAREDFRLTSLVRSDTASLNHMVANLVSAGINIHVMRDPTRGGLATSMVEIAESSKVSIRLDESAIPVKREVMAACEILGLDPLMVANEGKMTVFVPARETEKTLSIMRSHPEGEDSAIIGEVVEGIEGRVTIRSTVGGLRIVSRLEGELLPRIC